MAVAIFDADVKEAAKILEPYGLILRDLIAAAIATERERCAQLAEEFNPEHPIVSKIRSSHL